jgi:uncharacterized protein
MMDNQTGPPPGTQTKTPGTPRRRVLLPVPPINPYLGGALLGIAAVCSLLLVEMQFGVTPFYGYFSKFIRLAYAYGFDHQLIPRLLNSFRVQIQTYFALGIPIGAALAAWLANDWKLQAVPALWAKRFGPSTGRRLLWAFIGGFIAMCGVRLAGGCPSGLGLSGIIGLSSTGFIGLAMFLTGGVITARLIYRRGTDQAETASQQEAGHE